MFNLKVDYHVICGSKANGFEKHSMYNMRQNDDYLLTDYKQITKQKQNRDV